MTDDNPMNNAIIPEAAIHTGGPTVRMARVINNLTANSPYGRVWRSHPASQWERLHTQADYDRLNFVLDSYREVTK